MCSLDLIFQCDIQRYGGKNVQWIIIGLSTQREHETGVPENSEPEYRKYGSREILQAQNKEVSVNNKSRGEGLSQTNLVIVMNRRAQNNATT